MQSGQPLKSAVPSSSLYASPPWTRSHSSRRCSLSTCTSITWSHWRHDVSSGQSFQKCMSSFSSVKVGSYSPQNWHVNRSSSYSPSPSSPAAASASAGGAVFSPPPAPKHRWRRLGRQRRRLLTRGRRAPGRARRGRRARRRAAGGARRDRARARRRAGGGHRLVERGHQRVVPDGLALARLHPRRTGCAAPR